VDIDFRHIGLPLCASHRGTIPTARNIGRRTREARPSARCGGLNTRIAKPFRIEHARRRDVAREQFLTERGARHAARETVLKSAYSEPAALGQRSCFIAAGIALACAPSGRGEHGGGSVMELRTASPRKYAQPRLLNHCAQCGETIFLPEWSEYLDRHRVRHLWECEACGYKFETLVTFPDR
jgi:hypothetical protein